MQHFHLHDYCIADEALFEGIVEFCEARIGTGELVRKRIMGRWDNREPIWCGSN